MEHKAEVLIKKLGKGDLPELIELIKLFEEVFEMEDFSIPAEKYLQKTLDRNDFCVFVAKIGDKIVGGLTAYELAQYYSEKPLAYLYDLAVDTNLQRRGIGRMLIAEVNRFYKDKGFEEVFVQADKVDSHAIDFYRKTRPSEEEDVVYFSYKLN